MRLGGMFLFLHRVRPRSLWRSAMSTSTLPKSTVPSPDDPKSAAQDSIASNSTVQRSSLPSSESPSFPPDAAPKIIQDVGERPLILHSDVRAPLASLSFLRRS